MPTEEGTPAAVNAPAVDTQVTAPSESAPVETKAPVLDEDGIDISWAQNDGSDQPDDEPAESTPEPTEEQQEEAPDAESVDTQTEQEKTKADVRKEQLNTEIRDLVAQRNQIRQEVEQMNAQVYKPADVDELTQQVNPETGDYYNRLEAQIEAMRQEREVEKYNNQIAESKLTLSNEASKALQDFPMFDSQSPEYNPNVAQQVDQLLAQNLITDPNTGQIIGSNVSPYALYKTVADAYSFSAAQSAAKSQKAVEKMQSQADIPSSAPVKQTAKDINKLDADAYAKQVGLKEFRR